MWYEKYIGIPYKELGRDEKGLDCYGLCYQVYKNELGISIPDYYNVGFYKSEDKEQQEIIKRDLQGFILNEANNWDEVPLEDIKEFDIILFRMCGYIIHVGLALTKDTFLHCFNGTECCVERVYPRWTGKIYKAYRWRK